MDKDSLTGQDKDKVDGCRGRDLGSLMAISSFDDVGVNSFHGLCILSNQKSVPLNDGTFPVRVFEVYIPVVNITTQCNHQNTRIKIAKTLINSIPDLISRSLIQYKKSLCEPVIPMGYSLVSPIRAVLYMVGC